MTKKCTGEGDALLVDACRGGRRRGESRRRRQDGILPLVQLLSTLACWLFCVIVIIEMFGIVEFWEFSVTED